jgi:MFS family permease
MKKRFFLFRYFSTQFLILMLVAFVANFTYISTSILFALFAKKIGLNVTETGIVISALTLGALIGGPIWGKFVDRTGKRKITILISMIGQGVFCLITPFISGFFPLLMVRFGFGWFWVAQTPIVNEIIIKKRNIEAKNRELSWINIIRGVSYSIAMLISGYLSDFDPTWNFYLAGIVSLAIIYPILLLKKVDGLRSQEEGLKNDGKWILRWKNFLFYLPIFLRSTAVNGLSFFIPLFWKEKGLSAAFIGMVLGASNLIQLMFFPIVGKTCSRKMKNIPSLILFGYALTIIPFIVAPFLYRGISVFFPQSVLSISWVFFYIATTLLLGEIAPYSQRTEALGWMETAFNLGGTIGPITFSFILAGSSNNYPLSFLSFSLLVFSALIIFSSYERKYHHR